MPKLAMRVRGDTRAAQVRFKEYLESGMWQCPKGGAHHWVHVEDECWRCTKCNQAREFKAPNYSGTEWMGAELLWGPGEVFDRFQRGLIY